MITLFPHMVSNRSSDDTRTKYMFKRQVGNTVKETELMGKKYEKVEPFKYPGAMITSL